MFRKEFDIVRAVNGEEAVRICREMKPAAILMDIKMPVMDGLEATRRIRAFDPVVPIVAVTAFAYDRDRQKALDAGASEYLSKPLNGERLRQTPASCFRRIGQLRNSGPAVCRPADSGCHGCRCGSHTLLMQVRPAGNGNGPLPDRLISASRSFPQTETCLRPVQPPFPAATCRGARRRSCSCAQFSCRADKCVNRDRFPAQRLLGGAEQTISPGAAALFRKFVLSLQCFHETLFRKTGCPVLTAGRV
ncbi:MAG: response regulator [Alistipes finegoldii]